MLVGRGREEAAVEQLLAGARAGQGRALVLRGEAGVGKSALLHHARSAADGFQVLHAVGIESEAELAFAGLHQILYPLFDRIESLPAPQSAALRAAFALSDEIVAERFRISLAVLSVLAAAADERPVLCIVDDAQWLDQASAAALMFAARRIEVEPVALLFAVRDGSGTGPVLADLPTLRLEGLDSDDARALASRQFGAEATAAALDWVLANADGNPLALIELPQTLSAAQTSGREPLTGVLPPRTSIESAYLDRYNRLPGPARQLLLLAAAEQTGDLGTISRAALSLDLDIDGLSTPEVAGFVGLDLERVEFRHPLVRSAIYRGASIGDRERAHRALAQVLTGPADVDRRAWHRAAATTGTDEAVAEELEATADRAQLRAGYSGAATALERAAALSGSAKQRGRRLIRAARAAWQAGEPDRALHLLSTADVDEDEPWLCAESDHIRGLVELARGALLSAGAILIAGADRVRSHDPAKALEMLLDAGSAAGRSGNFARMGEAGERAAQLPTSAEPKDRVLCELLVGVGGLIEGRSAGEVSRIAAAVEQAGAFDDPRVLSWAAVGASTIGDQASEAALLDQALTLVRRSGSVDELVLILEAFVASAQVAGRTGFAAEAEEGYRLAREFGFRNTETAFAGMLSWIAGIQGDTDTCRQFADEVAAAARTSGMANANSIAQWAVAIAELGVGAADQAARTLSALRAAPPGEAHPFFIVMSAADLVEACLQTGQASEATSAFAPLEAFAQPGAPPWALAMAARCRALLSEGSDAERQFENALGIVAAAHRPFDRARTQLLYGSYLRRQRRRADARGHLRIAVEGFERLGAEAWAERARTELRATGETARKRDPSTITQLTPQELQIARLVASGNSNKDVATQLFLSPRTVEYHLAKVFTKLGISSRADLIRQSAVLEPAQ